MLINETDVRNGNNSLNKLNYTLIDWLPIAYDILAIKSDGVYTTSRYDD